VLEPMQFSSFLLTVGELTACLRSMLLQDERLQDVWVKGEVSNATISRSGHLFFSLVDVDAVVKCIVWAPRSYHLKEEATDGREVLAHGRVDIYPQQGLYQLYVDDILGVGIGLRHVEFERVRRHLESEGLFDRSRKRPLPEFPRRIGVVTSAYGAARRDIENVIQSRWPLAELILSPTSVQGDGAAQEIAEALYRIAHQPVDTIILARGGGNIEDLWCFNEECVARAIAAAPVPVITGIGHETDYTIADFVADFRAPTPSAAAAAAVPDGAELRRVVALLGRRLTTAATSLVADQARFLHQEMTGLRRLSPQYRHRVARLALEEQTTNLLNQAASVMAERRQAIHTLAIRAQGSRPRLDVRHDLGAQSRALHALAGSQLSELRRSVGYLAGRLRDLEPTSILKRGYAIVRQEDFTGPLVTSADSLAPGSDVAITFHDGGAIATVSQVQVAHARESRNQEEEVELDEHK